MCFLFHLLSSLLFPFIHSFSDEDEPNKEHQAVPEQGGGVAGVPVGAVGGDAASGVVTDSDGKVVKKSKGAKEAEKDKGAAGNGQGPKHNGLLNALAVAAHMVEGTTTKKETRGRKRKILSAEEAEAKRLKEEQKALRQILKEDKRRPHGTNQWTVAAVDQAIQNDPVTALMGGKEPAPASSSSSSSSSSSTTTTKATKTNKNATTKATKATKTNPPVNNPTAQESGEGTAQEVQTSTKTSSKAPAVASPATAAARSSDKVDLRRAQPTKAAAKQTEAAAASQRSAINDLTSSSAIVSSSGLASLSSSQQLAAAQPITSTQRFADMLQGKTGGKAGRSLPDQGGAKPVVSTTSVAAAEPGSLNVLLDAMMLPGGQHQNNKRKKNNTAAKTANESAAAAATAASSSNIRSKSSGGSSNGNGNGGQESSNVDNGNAAAGAANDEFVPLVVPGIGAPMLSPSHEFTGKRKQRR